MIKEDNWICTDPDNNQYGRKILEGVYEFKEKNRGLLEYGEDEYIQMTVYLNNYSSKATERYISAYYNSISEIREVYGEDTNWIIAECIFEQESGLY